MKTIQVGRPIEVDEKTATLLQRISEGEWDKIDPQVLRSAVPDTNVFLKFLERRDLTHTAEAKIVLRRLGIETAEPELSMAARVAKKSRDLGVLVKDLAAGRAKVAAKKMRKAKRRKKAKSPRK